MPITVTTRARPKPPTETPAAEPEPPTVVPPPSSKAITALIELAIVVLAVVLGIVIHNGVLSTTIVTSGSMESTIAVGDRLLVDRRSSLHHNWQRGDIVIFESPASWGIADTLVKRIIGLPGESLQLHGGQVLIGGQAIREDYLKEPPQNDEVGPYNLGVNQYFVMGDNRNNSDDSRDRGPINDKDITGRLVFRMAPLDRFGSIKHPAYH